MILYEDGDVSLRGMDYQLLNEFMKIAGEMADAVGKDKTIEAAVLGAYADNRAQMDRIHQKFLERGMNV